ncbi:replication associated protein [Microviridae sp.]|nr:replication associated protein [Microviridae sp.]
MSNREGIGANFFRLFWQDFADGFAVVDGQRLPLPRFYKKRLKLLGRFDDAMADAAVVGYARRSDNTPERLEVKAAILQARSKSLKRE